jgi:hypothetical protein
MIRALHAMIKTSNQKKKKKGASLTRSLGVGNLQERNLYSERR